jgi:hypothetical protein
MLRNPLLVAFFPVISTSHHLAHPFHAAREFLHVPAVIIMTASGKQGGRMLSRAILVFYDIKQAVLKFTLGDAIEAIVYEIERVPTEMAISKHKRGNGGDA